MDENDLVPITPREVLVKLGTSAVAHLAGGVYLFFMIAGAGLKVPGIVLSLVALVFGAVGLLSKDKEDKKPGTLITLAGVVGLLTVFGPPFLKIVGAIALGVGAVGLIASGIWKGIQYLQGLKTRQ